MQQNMESEAVEQLIAHMQQMESCDPECGGRCAVCPDTLRDQAISTLRALLTRAEAAEAQVKWWQADSAAGWNKCEERRLQAEQAEAERDDALHTLEAWFDLAARAEEAGADVLRDSVNTYLRTALNGGMPLEHVQVVRDVLDESARLYLWRALVPVLRTMQQDSTTTAVQAAIQAEREAIATWLETHICGYGHVKGTVIERVIKPGKDVGNHMLAAAIRARGGSHT